MTRRSPRARSSTAAHRPDPHPRWRLLARILLSLGMIGAGIAHLSTAREEFQAQVPAWVPLDPDLVVVGSGVVEIALGAGLLLSGGRVRRVFGWALAVFFVLIFPGNISQFVTGTDAFGLNSDTARAVRLLFQPMLVLWALYAVGPIRRHRPDRTPQGDTVTDLIALAWEGETALLRPEVRLDAARLDELLADDFVEIGQSGRRWDRAEIIAALTTDDAAPAAELSACEGRLLGPDTVLLSYRLDFGARFSRRSSLWRREAGAMRCLFHQGTPLPS